MEGYIERRFECWMEVRKEGGLYRGRAVKRARSFTRWELKLKLKLKPKLRLIVRDSICMLAFPHFLILLAVYISLSLLRCCCLVVDKDERDGVGGKGE